MKSEGKFAAFKKKLNIPDDESESSTLTKRKSRMNFSSKKGKLREALKRQMNTD